MWKLKVKEGLVNVKDENNMEIFEINIINNGKIEKNKLFLSEIEDEINLKIEIERTIYFSKSDVTCNLRKNIHKISILFNK